MANIIPTREPERVAWTLNFEQEFPALAAGLGFINTEQAALLEDSQVLRFAILNAQAGAAFSKACTAYKNGMLGGVGENQTTPTIPVWTPLAAPPEVDAGVIERLSNAMNRAKLNAGYTQAIGETLMIANVPSDSLNPNEGKPTGSATAMTGSVVRID